MDILYTVDILLGLCLKKHFKHRLYLNDLKILDLGQILHYQYRMFFATKILYTFIHTHLLHKSKRPLKMGGRGVTSIQVQIDAIPNTSLSQSTNGHQLIYHSHTPK